MSDPRSNVLISVGDLSAALAAADSSAADSGAADSSAADSGDERQVDLLWGLAVLQTLADAGEASAYQVEKLISAASGVIVADAGAAGDEEE